MHTDIRSGVGETRDSSSRREPKLDHSHSTKKHNFLQYPDAIIATIALSWSKEMYVNTLTSLRRHLTTIFTALLMAGSWSAMASAADAVTADTSPSDEDLSKINCSISEEQFLPGDYYYCLASQSYGYQRYVQAQRYFKTAASWASKPAQYVLGVMALNGDQQPIDRPLALAWFTLAAERHQADFEAAYKQLAASATPGEQAASETLLKELRLTYADDVAAPRAERRYKDGMRNITRGGYSGVHCLSGVGRAGGGSSDDSSVSNSSIACVEIKALVQTIDQAADKVFDGWSGHVTVGALQPAAAPSK
jgi:hypothetical protein